MGIFDIFKKKPQKNKYQVYYESITELLMLLERKKSMVENVGSGNSIVDLEFDRGMFERMMLVEIIERGSISFLGNDFQNNILEIFDHQEIRKNEIMNIWDYLLNEKNKLERLF